MEHAQRETKNRRSNRSYNGLNPYFNGTCSKSSFCAAHTSNSLYSGLNPYFNGTCSKSILNLDNMKNAKGVLILILMEHAQRDSGNCAN